MNKTPYNSPAHQDTQKQHKVYINQIKVLEKNTAWLLFTFNVKCLRQLKYIYMYIYIFCISEVYMMLMSIAYGNFNINNVHIYSLYISNVHVPMWYWQLSAFPVMLKYLFFLYKFIVFFNFIKQLTTFLWQNLNLKN